MPTTTLKSSIQSASKSPSDQRSRWIERIPLSQKQSLGEEIANSITHGTGVGLSIAALVILVVFAARQSDAWKVVAYSIYGAMMILMYLSSTLYHAFPQPTIKRFLRILDHSSICLLIAGTYTPVTIGLMRGGWGWTLFGLIWGFAIIGINLQIFVMGKLKWMSTVMYVMMGLMILIAIKPLTEQAPSGLITWLGIGGACYLVGVIFYIWRKLPYHHSLWHLFVLGGSISHFFGMLTLL
ncbi:MAG: hemolysin III family protein [Candidatus Cloacimonetes bacterium]|nr:hemolysin III family protein [Candidatus Cloacimonadota bacterium]